MNNKSILSLFIWWLKEYKKLGNERGYEHTRTKIEYDEQNIPIHNFFFYRKDAPIYNNNFAETVIELNPSINDYIDSLLYNKNGKIIRELEHRISEHVFKSKGFKEFQDIVFGKDVFFDIQYEDEPEFYLTSIFKSVLQEYSDLKGGIYNVLKKNIDHKLVNNLLNKYLLNLKKRSLEIELIVPIIGAKWIKEGDGDLFEEIEDNMNIRLITKEEQDGRAHYANTELDGFFDYKEIENERNIYKSNLAICIKEKIPLKKLLNSETKAINEIYEKYHLKINTILNLLFLENKENHLEIKNTYFKCEGYIFNYLSLPISMWIPTNIMPRNIVKLSGEESSYKPTKINKELVLKVISMYKKIIESSVENGKRIQGAFLRKTRSQMDINETEGLLDSIIGVELLLSGSGQNSELSFRTSLYVCNILHKSKNFENKSKKEIYEEFKDLYGMRSSFVHSGKKVKNQRALLYLSSLLEEIINSEIIFLNSEELISNQIQNIYLFSE